MTMSNETQKQRTLAGSGTGSALSLAVRVVRRTANGCVCVCVCAVSHQCVTDCHMCGSCSQAAASLPGNCHCIWHSAAINCLRSQTSTGLAQKFQQCFFLMQVQYSVTQSLTVTWKKKCSAFKLVTSIPAHVSCLQTVGHFHSPHVAICVLLLDAALAAAAEATEHNTGRGAPLTGLVYRHCQLQDLKEPQAQQAASRPAL